MNPWDSKHVENVKNWKKNWIKILICKEFSSLILCTLLQICQCWGYPKHGGNISFIICKSTNESTIIINIFKLLGSYMFRHHCVIIRELAFITSPNYIRTVAAVVKINKIKMEAHVSSKRWYTSTTMNDVTSYRNILVIMTWVPQTSKLNE